MNKTNRIQPHRPSEVVRYRDLERGDVVDVPSHGDFILTRVKAARAGQLWTFYYKSTSGDQMTLRRDPDASVYRRT